MISTSITSRPTDTSAAAWQAYYDTLGRLAPQQRLAMACELSDNMRALALAGIRARHPEYSETEVALEWLRLTLEPAQFSAVRQWLRNRP